jgi:imidazolonepropionase-like amidohydrolase
MFPSAARSTAVFLLALVAAFGLVACSHSRSETVAITHVTVIDPSNGSSQADITVVTRAKTIIAVGPSSSTAVPGNAKVIDGTGKFLIPGLADMHTHLTGAGEPTGSREFILPLLIANGVTTVRDMGGKVEYLESLRKEIDSGKRVGPQIFFTGPYLDGNPPSFQPSIVVQDAAEGQRAVDDLKSEGVNFIKVQSRLQPEAYYAIAAEAKKNGIRFVGHVPDSITAAAASDAGQASIEHLTGVLLGCSTHEAKLREQKLQRAAAGESQEQALERDRTWTEDLLDSYSDRTAASLFRKFAANRTWQVPTFPLLVYLAYITPETDRIGDPKMKYVPHAEKQIWDQSRREMFEGRTEADFELRRKLVRQSMAAVLSMRQAGVNLMAGTDAAAPNVYPGFSLHEDLAFLVKAGLTPLEALQAATSKPAEFLEQSDKQGAIRAGMKADLVLLDANPLEDIHNTQKIRAVMVDGRFFNRSDLDALLDGVERFAQTH